MDVELRDNGIAIRASLLHTAEILKTTLESKVSNGTLLAVLQENPCLVKCAIDIKSPTYGANIDQYYIARHDYARIALIDQIAQEFCGDFAVGAEHVTNTGKLDVSIRNQNIILKNGSRVIGCEVKSGKSLDLFQLMRYLLEVDKLVLARVATKDVVVISRSDIKQELDRIGISLQHKANLIIEGRQYKVEGPWCYECKADCEYRKKRSASQHVPSLEGLSDFFDNVSSTVEKTMIVLRKELAQ